MIGGMGDPSESLWRYIKPRPASFAIKALRVIVLIETIPISILLLYSLPEAARAVVGTAMASLAVITFLRWINRRDNNRTAEGPPDDP
jgi:hypothetical protein